MDDETTVPTRPITRDELERVVEETVRESWRWSRGGSEVDVVPESVMSDSVRDFE